MAGNSYDDARLNIRALLEAQADTKQAAKARRPIASFSLGAAWAVIRRYALSALYVSGLWRRLIYMHLVIGWFNEFREYWVHELGLRRIELHDFYFLANVYRQRFQNLELENEHDPAAFLTAWQSPAALYLLFAYQYKLAMHPLGAHTLARYIPRASRVLEYGCGLGPITQALVKHYRHHNHQITAADIPSYMLHFLRWKFRDQPEVKIHALEPGDSAPLAETYDVIACMTVFEHLPNPLAIAQHLHQQLAPGGLFMFDYIKSEGEGLDTKQALQDRRQVIDFVRSRYTIVRGRLPDNDASIKAIICKKRK